MFNAGVTNLSSYYHTQFDSQNRMMNLTNIAFTNASAGFQYTQLDESREQPIQGMILKGRQQTSHFLQGQSAESGWAFF